MRINIFQPSCKRIHSELQYDNRFTESFLEAKNTNEQELKSNPHKVFFTSDLHFGHANVIRFDNRPFATVEEMDAELIRRWNDKVAKGDLVYVLGDMI